MKIAKKQVGLLLCLCMVLTALCGMTVGAAVDYGLIVNGGFDIADEENELLPQGWSFNGDAAWIDNSYASIPIVGTGTAIKQIIYPLSGEAITGTYTLTFRYKLSTADVAEVYGYTYYAEEGTEATKAFRTKLPATTATSDDWVEFSLKTDAPTAGKTVAYMTLIFRGFSEVENCTLCVDDVALIKDENLLADSAFSIIDNWKMAAGYTCDSNGEYKVAAKDMEQKDIVKNFSRTDTSCPEGNSYIQFDDEVIEKGIKNPYICTVTTGNKGYITEGLTDNVAAGTRYKFSVWYKTSAETTMTIYTPMPNVKSSTTPSANFCPSINITENTNGQWKKFECTFEKLPDPCQYFQIGLKASGTFAGDNYVAFHNPQLMQLKDSYCELGLYRQTHVTFTRNYESSATYANVLGEPITSLKGYSGTVSAVYSSINGSKDKGDTVVLAAYTKNGNGVKQLVNFEFMDYATQYTESTLGDVYPTATLNMADLPEGTVVRAFAFDSKAGLKPIDNFISMIK